MSRNLRNHRCRRCAGQGQRNVDQSGKITIFCIQSRNRLLFHSLRSHCAAVHETVYISVYVINKCAENNRHDNENDQLHDLCHAVIAGVTVTNNFFADNFAIDSINNKHENQGRKNTCSRSHSSSGCSPPIKLIRSCICKVIHHHI